MPVEDEPTSVEVGLADDMAGFHCRSGVVGEAPQPKGVTVGDGQVVFITTPSPTGSRQVPCFNPHPVRINVTGIIRQHLNQFTVADTSSPGKRSQAAIGMKFSLTIGFTKVLVEEQRHGRSGCIGCQDVAVNQADPQAP